MFKFFGGKKGDPSEDESMSESYYTESNYQDDEYSEQVTGDAQLLPGDFEKRSLLAMFGDMRKDNQFCDVAFLCHGVLFSAHKVVVSGWSRWIRALLSETYSEEAIHVDHFAPDAFGAVLDYMYGTPLTVTVETAESIIKVVRRLEMQKLEQQCWRYMMTVVDSENSALLHELADRYDCPPLKLTAWRIIQESIPGYSSSAAAKLLGGMTTGKTPANNGLTGPGEPQLIVVGKTNKKGKKKNKNRHGSDDDDDDSGTDEDEDGNGENKSDGDEEEDAEEDEAYYDEDERRNFPSVFADNYDDENDEEASRPPPKLEQLGPMATAEDRVKAWAAHLKTVYRDCTPVDSEDYADVNNFKIPSDGTDNVRIVPNSKTARKAAAAAAAAAAADDASEESSVADTVQESKGFFSNLLRRPGDDKNKNKEKEKEKEKKDKPKPLPSKAESVARAKRGLPVTSSGPGHVDWSDELRNFYTSVGAKEKIAGIPTILVTWAGKEEDMMNALEDKYADKVTKKLRQHLDELYDSLEAHTESSFVQQKPRNSGVVGNKRK